MKIAFVCDLPDEHFVNWNDGLKAALDVLRSRGHQIDIYNHWLNADGQRPDPKEYDLGLIWSGLTGEIAKYRVFSKQALCFGGGPTYHPSLFNFDLVFAESKVDLLDFKRFGKETIQAFGTNTDLFYPMPEQPKIYDYVYPAAFAKWKHHEKFAEYINKNRDGDAWEPLPSLAFGYMQPDGWEKECYEICQQHGIAVMPQVPYQVMPWILNASQHVYIGADSAGGCQRTILEAKACNIPLVLDSDSPKLKELEKLTFEDITKHWSQISYADKLEEGLTKLWKK